METIGQRIRFRRKQLKLTQKELGLAIGVTASTITQYEKDIIIPKAEPTRLLSKTLQCDFDWLMDGGKLTSNLEPNASVITLTSLRLPVLSYVQAGIWTDSGDVAPITDITEWVNVDSSFSKNSFALRIRGDSMEGKSPDKCIPHGSVVTVETNFDPLNLNGCVVVAMLDGSNEATVKELQLDGPNKYLVPWNERYDVIKINGNCRIVGYVKDVIIRLGNRT